MGPSLGGNVARPLLVLRPVAVTFRKEYTSSCRFRSEDDLAQATLLTFAVWNVLLLAPLFAVRGVRGPLALLAAFLVGTLLAAAARPLRPRRRRGGSALLLGLGLVAGGASYPAWAVTIAGLGLLLGLGPRTPVPAGAGTPELWVATVGLAPVLEELVYRERLLPALDRRLGPIPAVMLSSAAFALPHVEPWTVLATFLVGLALGAVMRLGGAVALCIGLHMGLNGAALLRGAPPADSVLSMISSAFVAAAVLVVAIALARNPYALETA